MSVYPSFVEYQRLLHTRLLELTPPLCAYLRALRERPFHPEVDLLQFEMMHEDAAEVFPIFLLTKRRCDGVDRYCSGQSYDYRREWFEDRERSDVFSGFERLLQEPLMVGELVRYFHLEHEETAPDEDYDEMIERCDIYFFEAVGPWFYALWKQEIGADLPISSYFLQMGDDAGGNVFDLRTQQEIPWEQMYKQE
ncbi:hypothetical protein L6R29_23670 [Myxococcota bacterium]|nr:hypothetical protein [Myxococcota bacterium]